MEALIKQFEGVMKQKKNQLKQAVENVKKAEENVEKIKKEINELEVTLRSISQACQIPLSEETEEGESSQKMSWADQVEKEIEKKEEEKEEKKKEIEKEKKKWYVIFNGSFKGVYKDWHIARQHIDGHNVTHKSYNTKEEADEAFKNSFKEVLKASPPAVTRQVSLGKLPIKVTDIPTTREKAEFKKPSPEKFNSFWQSITSYKEVHTTMGFYPKMRSGAPKAIFLPGASPLAVFDYFQHGFTDAIYFTSKEISEFPQKLQLALKSYDRNFARGRSMFMKTFSSYPFFNEQKEVTVPSISLCFVGIFDGQNHTPRDEPQFVEPSTEVMARILAGVFHASQQVAVPGKKMDVRVLYCSKTCLVYSNFKRDITEEEAKVFVKFEEPFKNFTGALEKLPVEVKMELCKHLSCYGGHLCDFCPIGDEDVPATFVESSGEEDYSST